MILHTLPVGPLHTNCYLVGCSETRRALVIDPGGDAEKILKQVRQLDLQVDKIVLTHSHWDHVLAAAPVRQATGARLAVHTLDAEEVRHPPAFARRFLPELPEGTVIDDLFEEEVTLPIGELAVQVLLTPGHSPGGISLYIASEKVVFTGDALFREGIGRTDFAGSNHEQLMQSIRQRLFILPDETTAYPGHGPSTSIGHERQHNPWVAQGPS